MQYFIGLTQWHHADWYAARYANSQALQVYAQHFSSVEGNHSFYGLPSAQAVQQWREHVPASFRFCFKFPKSISHQAQLQHCQRETTEFLQRIAPLHANMGVIWLQMSPRFSAQALPELQRFLQNLPKDFEYGIEVRHADFFNKANSERRFNRLLMASQVNRVMFDTRVLFKHPSNEAATQDALRKKPHVPLHVIATGQQPLVRFISPLSFTLADEALQQWCHKAGQWMSEGREPYFFFHTPNNQHAPLLAQRFSEKMATLYPQAQVLTLWDHRPTQTALF